MTQHESLGPLTDAETRQLALLLKRYAMHDLDQFETWRTSTPTDEVYILIRRRVSDDEDPDYYNDIDHWRTAPQ
ncbi:hypothetical protein OG216_27505 [Streptomycetaceae bacterium NBC_01309]